MLLCTNAGIRNGKAQHVKKLNAVIEYRLFVIVEETRIKGDVENGSFLIGYFKGGNLAAVGTIGKGKSLIRYGLLLDKGKTISIEDFEKGL